MTTISPIRYDVEIQEPLSTPVPIPPSMSSSEALVIWMFKIAMNAPIIAAVTDSHVTMLARGAGRIAAAGAGPVTATSVMTSPRGLQRELRRVRMGSGRLGLDARYDGHAGPQFQPCLIEQDFYGNPLHHLGEVAGRVVGRQQREFLTARRRQTVDM